MEEKVTTPRKLPLELPPLLLRCECCGGCLAADAAETPARYKALGALAEDAAAALLCSARAAGWELLADGEAARCPGCCGSGLRAEPAAAAEGRRRAETAELQLAEARAELAASQAREKELIHRLRDLQPIDCCTEYKAWLAREFPPSGPPPWHDPDCLFAPLADHAPPPSALLAVVELEERNAKTHRQSGHYRAAHVLERFARRLRAAIGLPAAGGSR